jgi:hypothetical protein
MSWQIDLIAGAHRHASTHTREKTFEGFGPLKRMSPIRRYRLIMRGFGFEGVAKAEEA